MVRQIDRFILGIERRHHQHRTENLFSVNLHVDADIRIDRRPHEISVTIFHRPIDVEHLSCRAFRDASVDVALHAFELAAGDQGPDHRSHVERVADADIEGQFTHPREKAFLH